VPPARPSRPAALSKGCATVEVMGVMLQRDWAEGLELAAIGLDGLGPDGFRRFVTTGRR